MKTLSVHAILYTAQATKGEFIAIVESDDVLAPNMYEELYDLAIETGADVVKGPYYEYFSNGTLRDCSYRRKLKTSVPQKKCFSAVDYGEIYGLQFTEPLI